METPPPSESSNTSVRLVQVKNGTIAETITDAFYSLPSWFRGPQTSPAPVSSSNLDHELSQMISKITLKDIQGAKHLGGGSFGTVRIFEHPRKGKVALKQLLVSGAQLSDDLRRRTLREGETWQRLKHPCVLPFLGILETPTDLYLVSPYAKNGSLDDYLRQNPNIDRHKFLWKTAGAIAYLHAQRIIHGDIKPANILVSNDIEPLLCDFGLAKTDNSATSVGLQGVGTIRFQSPEILIDGGGKSFASDVWAFGMTISEVLSGKLPFHQHTMPTAIISAVVIRDERPPTLPSHSLSGLSYEHIWSIAKSCWERVPARRASMKDIYRRLRPDGLTLRGHIDGVVCLAMLPDEITVVSGSQDYTLQLWDAPSGIRRGEALKGHTKSVNCLTITPDGTTIVSGSWDNTLRLWDVVSGSQRGEPLEGHTDWVNCLAITPDGKTIVSGSWDHTLRLWDVVSGMRRGEALKGHIDVISCLAITPDGMTVVSGSQDRTLRMWDVASGSQRAEPLEGHIDWVSCLAITPDGTTIVSGSWDRTIRLWDVISGSQRCEPLKGHIGPISCLKISPDGMTIVSGSQDRSLRLWDAASGTQRGEALWGHTDRITCVAITPDNKTIVSGSQDCTLRLWDMASGRQQGEPLKGHTMQINCLAVSPDGMTVVSGSDNGTLRLWNIESDSQTTEPVEGAS